MTENKKQPKPSMIRDAINFWKYEATITEKIFYGIIWAIMIASIIVSIFVEVKK